MFNKYRNIKLIGSIIIVLALVIIVAANVRFRSVKQYNEDASRIASEQESLAKEYEENLDNESDSNLEDIASSLEELSQNQSDETMSSSDDQKVQENVTTNESSDLNKTDIEEQENSKGIESNSNGSSSGGSSSTSSGSNSSSKSYIKVTIRITVAVLLEESNYSRLSDTVKASIPANGNIAYETLYLEEGSSVLDALVAVTNKNGISITNKSGYISQIAGFGEKIFGGSADYSGWTYYLNHDTKLINSGAGAKKLTDGDYICWWYTTNWGDYKGY